MQINKKNAFYTTKHVRNGVLFLFNATIYKETN